MSNIILTITNDTAQLSGDLIRQTVPSIANKKLKLFLKQKKTVIDLTGVSKIDTAGLAWLLSQVETAQVNSCQLCFEHLPANLIKLATLSSVENFLPVSPTS